MTKNNNHAFKVLGQVRKEVLNAYAAKADLNEVPIAVDILRDIIKERCELKTISWLEVDVDTPEILGSVKFYYPVPNTVRVHEKPTTAIIRVRANLNFCWKRFVICKEMSHCLVDSESDRVSSVQSLKELAEGLASKISIPGKNNGPLSSELWAELLAMELLFPYELRRTHIEDFRAGKITPHNLALRYRIPVEYAELGMYEQTLALMEGLG